MYMYGLNKFDTTFLFLSSNLAHNDVCLHFVNIKSWSKVTIEHEKFNNKNYKFF